MFFSLKTKLYVITGALAGVVFLMFLTPFLITSGTKVLSKSVVQAIFITVEFLGAIYLLNEFNRLRIIIKEKEMGDKRLENIERDIHKLSHFKQSEIGMKGIILSGGTATRLYPLTITTSKQLLPVYDYPMIFYSLNTLIKAGIRDILMIVSPEHSGQYLNLLGSTFKKYGVNIYFEVQKVPRGLSDAFILGENFIADDNVTLILGDNIFEDDMSEVIRNFKSGGHVLAVKVPDPERFGVVKFDEKGKAEKIVEKPQEFLSEYAIPGFYVYDNEVVKVAKSLTPSDRGEIEITELHNHYLEQGKLQVTPVEGAWLDAGTFDSLLDAGNVSREKKISANFDPIIVEAVSEFNRELKHRSKSVLKAHNLFLREEKK